MKKAAAILLCAAVLLCAFAFGAKPYQKAVLYPRKYAGLIEQYSAEYGVDANLMFAVVRTESSFRPDAVSDAGAAGLTQITEETFDWIKWKLHENSAFADLFTPETSLPSREHLGTS